MVEIGVQTHNAVCDEDPETGFALIREAGFTCCDFSLNNYLKNTDLYKFKLNGFFNPSISELERFFTPHREAAKKLGIRIHQMHMPYPNFVPDAPQELNDYLVREMAPKSMELCSFFDCRYIVVHGLKVKRYYGTEEAEWEKTEEFLDTILPMAKEQGITVCVENIYTSAGAHIIEGPCCNAAKAVERIDRINERYHAEVLGFCFDTGHANLVGIDFEKFLLTLGSRIKVLHIHDNDGISDLHQMPFTFTKTRENHPSTDWEGFLRGLKAIGFEKVLSFETAPVLQSFPPELRGQALHLIAEIGNYFKKRLEEVC